MTRLPLSSLLIASVLASALAGCARKTQEPGPKAASAPVPEDVKALEASLAPSPSAPAGEGNVLLATGELVPPVRSELVSRVTGRVLRILVDEGARVAAGQPMLELETDYLKLDVTRAEAEVARAAAAASEAERDFNRKKELIARQSVAPAVYDRSLAALEQANAARQAAQAALDLAKQRLSDAVLRSPIDGVVLERKSDVGERLSEGTVTFVVVQTAPLKLRFRVPERYLGTVATGAKVKAQVDPYPSETFDGKVSVVVPAIDPSSRTFAVEALFDNRDGRLRPGLFARVTLDLGPTGK
ncbi:MAG: Multidrug resistance protein MdtA [Thermoanaerobaculia bacterium]|nr:Multidrug resistance protein MdtA [Thermoanaerobaculia bacterium]